MPAGRPSDYDADIAAEICSRMAEGKSLKEICEADDMPSRTTVYRWRFAHEEFRDMYARAKEDRGDTYADEIVDIADMPGLLPDEKRVRIDARKWVASKLNRRDYGDKVTNEHTGANGGPLVVKILNFVDAGDHASE